MPLCRDRPSRILSASVIFDPGSFPSDPYYLNHKIVGLLPQSKSSRSLAEALGCNLVGTSVASEERL